MTDDNAALAAAAMRERAAERALADADTCVKSAKHADEQGHDSAADQDRQAAHIARGIAAAIRALPLPGDPLPAALRLPEVAKLVEAATALIDHDAFEPQYLSADLNSKMEAVRAALAAIRARVKGETT